MPQDIDPRLLRAFTATAEELHFTRAAARLFVAQQALSRDIRRLERELGAELFVRTTRAVELTADGTRLLPHARRVLAAHDELRAAWAVDARPLIVDIGAPVGTGHRVLTRAREVAPGPEFVVRYLTGLTGAAADILAGRVDVSFGRVAGLEPSVLAGLAHQPVRYERMAVLLPDDHRLAHLAEIPVDTLKGETLYAGVGNPATAEWTDLAARLFAGRGVELAPPFPEISGEEEFTRVVRGRGWSVLASMDFLAIPGMTLRPLTAPVPLSPVSLVWRKGLRHPGLEVLREVAHGIATANAWLEIPQKSWLPDVDLSLMSQ
ncbi:LysR family transcriptional regulator [Streptomyces sp. CBMA152]|uniref:LysR family transcriptional regulator n=1 Tax=Streptomyces sp. CBMA152 TaxID=1896312 RepID=UPI001660E87A|nr:LysR family transcriptional regulator [Streptomyces sp. CBMA152]MBD0743040.1 LysR family transcriptional regulator [Streptomyces sp. CBMA152]